MRAWSGLRTQEPRNLRAWLYQVARNRCSDYLRSPQRRERIVGAEDHAHREPPGSGGCTPAPVGGGRDRRLGGGAGAGATGAAGVLSGRNEHRRDSRPPSLSARNGQATAVPRPRPCAANWASPKRGGALRCVSTTGKPRRGRFPSVARRSRSRSTIDLRELAWWFIVPELGEQVRWAEYEQTRDGSAPKLTEVNSMVARRPAIVHGRECVEIEVANGRIAVRAGPAQPCNGRTRVWGRLDEKEVRGWPSRLPGGATAPESCRPSWTKARNFGSTDRLIEDKEYLTERSDGTFVRSPDAPRASASGDSSACGLRPRSGCNRVRCCPT